VSFMASSGGPRRATFGLLSGTVEPAPEMNLQVGKINYQHVDVCQGEGAGLWSDLVSNVAKNLRFGGEEYPFCEGYLGWRR